MTELNWEWILGGLLVLATVVAGIFTMHANLKSSQGPRERRFVWVGNLGLWIGIVVLLALPLVVSTPYKLIFPALLVILVPAFVFWCTRRRLLLREVDRMQKLAGSEGGDDRGSAPV